MSKESMQQALAALKEYDALIKHRYSGSRDAMSDLQYATWNGRDCIEALEAELAKPEPFKPDWVNYRQGLEDGAAQPERPHPDHYAEVYIRVGDSHVKKVLTQIELSHAYDPIKLLSLVAYDCVQKIKELS